MNIKIISFLFAITSLTNYSLNGQRIYFNKYIDVSPDQKNIRIASVSVIPDKWQKETNWNRIEMMVREAAMDGGAKLVVTPEGALEGYVINEVNKKWKLEKDENILEQFFNLGEPLDGPFIQRASSLAKEVEIYFILGFLEREVNNLYNSSILIDPEGDIIGRYRKTHFAQGYVENPEFYKAGNQFPVFHTSFGKIGILICYDRQLPEPARILRLNGAEILVIPSYGGYSAGNGWNTIMLRTRARENGIPLVFCHPYQSLLIDKNGDIVELGTAGNISYYEVNISDNKRNVLRNRRPKLYNKLHEENNFK